MSKKVMFVMLAVFAVVAAGLAMTQDVKILFAPAKPAVALTPAAQVPVTTEAEPVLDDCCAVPPAETATAQVAPGQRGQRQFGPRTGGGAGAGGCPMMSGGGQVAKTGEQQCCDE